MLGIAFLRMNAEFREADSHRDEERNECDRRVAPPGVPAGERRDMDLQKVPTPQHQRRGGEDVEPARGGVPPGLSGGDKVGEHHHPTGDGGDQQGNSPLHVDPPSRTVWHQSSIDFAAVPGDEPGLSCEAVDSSDPATMSDMASNLPRSCPRTAPSWSGSRER